MRIKRAPHYFCCTTLQTSNQRHYPHNPHRRWHASPWSSSENLVGSVGSSVTPSLFRHRSGHPALAVRVIRTKIVTIDTTIQIAGVSDGIRSSHAHAHVRVRVGRGRARRWLRLRRHLPHCLHPGGVGRREVVVWAMSAKVPRLSEGKYAVCMRWKSEIRNQVLLGRGGSSNLKGQIIIPAAYAREI